MALAERRPSHPRSDPGGGPEQPRWTRVPRDAVCVGLVHCAARGAGEQEDRGHADPRQVCHGGPIGAVRVVAQPSPRLTVWAKACHGPARFVRLDPPSRRPRRLIGHQAADVPGESCTRADDRPGPTGTALKPARLDRAGCVQPVRRGHGHCSSGHRQGNWCDRNAPSGGQGPDARPSWPP